jgi:hypothetical protein
MDLVLSGALEFQNPQHRMYLAEASRQVTSVPQDPGMAVSNRLETCGWTKELPQGNQFRCSSGDLENGMKVSRGNVQMSYQMKGIAMNQSRHPELMRGV